MGALRTVTISVVEMMAQIVSTDYEEVWRRMDGESAVSTGTSPPTSSLTSSPTLTVSSNEMSEITNERWASSPTSSSTLTVSSNEMSETTNERWACCDQREESDRLSAKWKGGEADA